MSCFESVWYCVLRSSSQWKCYQVENPSIHMLVAPSNCCLGLYMLVGGWTWINPHRYTYPNTIHRVDNLSQSKPTLHSMGLILGNKAHGKVKSQCANAYHCSLWDQIVHKQQQHDKLCTSFGVVLIMVSLNSYRLMVVKLG